MVLMVFDAQYSLAIETFWLFSFTFSDRKLQDVFIDISGIINSDPDRINRKHANVLRKRYRINN